MEIQQAYDKTAKIYNQRYRQIQIKKYEQMIKTVKDCQHMSLSVLGNSTNSRHFNPKGKILDLGSGTGLLSEFLNFSLTQADISFQMLKQAKGIRVQADGECLPFKDNSFDSVLSFTALQNSKAPEKMLKEISRVLKPRGLLYLTCLKKKCPKIIAQNLSIIKILDVGEDFGFIAVKL